MFMERTNPVSAVLVGAYDSDRQVVQEVFRKQGWKLFEACDRRKAMEYLNRQKVHVVIAETDVPDWHWKKVLSDLRRMNQPPVLIVTSHLADESLWAEVLNVGGYDVLVQPLLSDELERVIASAHRHFEYKPERVSRPAAAAGAA